MTKASRACAFIMRTLCEMERIVKYPSELYTIAEHNNKFSFSTRNTSNTSNYKTASLTGHPVARETRCVQVAVAVVGLNKVLHVVFLNCADTCHIRVIENVSTFRDMADNY